MASTKRKRNYSGADTPVGDDKRPRHYKPDVLLLRFEYTDLPNLNEEIDNLCKIFKAKKCDVTLAVIPMKDPWAFIRPQVLKFLRVYHQSQTRNKIIVISGHGGWSAGTELCFCSHNVPDRVSQLRSDVRTLLELHDSMQKQMVLTNIDEDKLKSIKRCYQPRAEFSWINLKGLIENAQCHVLVFLDCCDAGGAAFSGGEEKTDPVSQKYAKSVIYACHWKAITSGEFSKALCKIISNWEPRTEKLSANTIVNRIGHTVWEKARQNEQAGATQQLGKWDKVQIPSQPGIFDIHGQRDDGSKEQFILTDTPMSMACLKS